MISTKQLAANRRNTALSTGPKTEKSLKVASMNAQKHGLLAKETITDTEDFAQLEDFAMGLKNSFLPQDELEHLLVERIISCAWRLKHILKIEALLFRSKDVWDTCQNVSGSTSFETKRGDKILLLSRYEIALERSLYRALSELRQIQLMRSTINANGFVS